MTTEARRAFAPTHAGSELPRMRARYLTQALALEEQPAPHIAHYGVGATVALVIGAIAWAAITEVPEVSHAVATIEPRGELRSVQHLEGGLVNELRVANGDYVQAGDVLATLAEAPAASDQLQLAARRAGLTLRLGRLEAQLSGADALHLATATTAAERDLAAREEMLFEQTRASRRAQREVLDLERLRHVQEIAGIERQLTSLDEEIAALEQKRDMYASGESRLVVPRGDLLDVEARLARTRADYREQEAARDNARMAAAAAQSKILELEQRAREQDRIDIGQASAELAELEAAAPRSADRVERLELRAPVAGVIKGLTINAAGAVIEPGGTLLDIVPEGVPLQVEAQVSTTDIGHVHAGQEVEVTVHSYEPQRFGTVRGTVRQVSASTYLDAEQRPYYRAEIELAHPYVGSEPGRSPLMAGMTADARIILGHKSVLDYLLAPVYAGLDAAFTER